MESKSESAEHSHMNDCSENSCTSGYYFIQISFYALFISFYISFCLFYPNLLHIIFSANSIVHNILYSSGKITYIQINRVAVEKYRLNQYSAVHFLCHERMRLQPRKRLETKVKKLKTFLSQTFLTTPYSLPPNRS